MNWYQLWLFGPNNVVIGSPQSFIAADDDAAGDSVKKQVLDPTVGWGVFKIEAGGALTLVWHKEWGNAEPTKTITVRK